VQKIDNPQVKTGSAGGFLTF